MIQNGLKNISSENTPLSKTLTLPDWITSFINQSTGKTYPSDEDKIILAIELSRLNVLHKTGGPFGSAVFNAGTNELVAAGVNRVVPENASIAHGEIMALLMAQEKLKTFSLCMESFPSFTLATSAQPCAMCYGALIWSGIKKILIGARGEDVESITGFDEGPLHPDWISEAEKRGISIKRDIGRNEACAVLRHYVETEGKVYNPDGKAVCKDLKNTKIQQS